MRSISRMIAMVGVVGLMLAIGSRANAMTPVHMTPVQSAPSNDDGLVVQVHGGHGGGHGGGHMGGMGHMGGGHMGGGMHFHHHRRFGAFFVGPGFYDYGPDYYGPDYYYEPQYAGGYCHLVETAEGPRRVCGWPHRHWHHHHHRHHHHHWHHHHHHHHYHHHH